MKMSFTQERWERWEAGQTDERHQLATDERTDEENRDAKEVAPRETFVLRDGPHHSKKNRRQKN